MFKINDYVSRNKYHNDFIFVIEDIKDDIYYLKGVNQRIFATSFKDDLKKEEYKEENDEFLLNDDTSLIYGRVLHIDSDENYLKKSSDLYSKNKINYKAYLLKEAEIPSKIMLLLIKHKPDVLVITGHDNNQDQEYKNSNYFIESVKKARIYEPNKDALVIFAGACQSNFEALMAAGCNFASSPSRVSINVLDPVKIAVYVAKGHVGSYLDIEKILNETSNKNKGIGGIDTRGVARKIY